MSEKLEFPWEAELPAPCRTCTQAKYIYSVAHDAYRAKRDLEAIRAAMRDAMRIGGDKVVEAVRKWMSA